MVKENWNGMRLKRWGLSIIRVNILEIVHGKVRICTLSMYALFVSRTIFIARPEALTREVSQQYP